ncbi:MAG: acyl carrier protein [Clostridia bacterium]|nr:acyl carrier protein [Clostridia bacterium]
MLETLREVICRYVDIDPATLTEDTNIRSELGLNSLELINIAVAIEDEFDVEIPDREVGNIETLGDAIKVIEKYMED